MQPIIYTKFLYCTRWATFLNSMMEWERQTPATTVWFCSCLLKQTTVPLDAMHTSLSPYCRRWKKKNYYTCNWMDCVCTDLCSLVVLTLGVLWPDNSHKNRLPSAEPAATNRPSGLSEIDRNTMMHTRVLQSHSLHVKFVPKCCLSPIRSDRKLISTAGAQVGMEWCV